MFFLKASCVAIHLFSDTSVFFFLVFCDGLEIITEADSVGSRQIRIKFNHVREVNSHNDLMGYTVLYKEKDEDEWWQPVDIRGGWQRDATVKNLQPYTNYSFRVALYSFRASGLAGPVAVIETLEDGG